MHPHSLRDLWLLFMCHGEFWSTLNQEDHAIGKSFKESKLFLDIIGKGAPTLYINCLNSTQFTFQQNGLES